MQAAEVRVTCPGDQQLDVAELFGGAVHKPFDRFGVRDVQRQRDGLATAGADLVDQLLALVDAPSAKRNREAARGKLGRGRGADSG